MIIEENDRPFYSILVVGAPKTGKTFSLATLHAWLKQKGYCTEMHLFDLDEDGAEPLIRQSIAQAWRSDLKVHRFHKKQGERLTALTFPNRNESIVQDFIDEYARLYDRLDERTYKWKPGQEIGAVIIDSLTALQEKLFDFILKKRGKEIGGGSGSSVEFNEWNLLAAKILETIRSGKALPCVFVCLAHEELREEISRGIGGDNKTTGNTLIVPMVTGGLRYTIGKDFGVVLYSQVSGGKYEWITQPNSKVKSAGSRARESIPAVVKQDYREVL